MGVPSAIAETKLLVLSFLMLLNIFFLCSLCVLNMYKSTEHLTFDKNKSEEKIDCKVGFVNCCDSKNWIQIANVEP